MMLFAVFAAGAFAEDDAAPMEAHAEQAAPRPSLATGFKFFGYLQTRAALNNLESTNPFLDGQVIGKLGGTNGVVPTAGVRAAYTEQRLGANFDFRPKLLNGHAGLSAAFEIDWAFGDRSYGVGGNTGAAFGGDMVNLQTRRLHADVYSGGKNPVHVVVGLQFVGDGVADPTASTPDGLIRSGGRLMFFGSEAAGLAAYGRVRDASGDVLRYRLGSFTLYENGMSRPDDVWLNVADVDWHPAYATTVGLHGWYLQDRSGGSGGVLGVGPSSALSELQGGPKIDLYDGATATDPIVDADLFWAGADAGYNPALDRGRIGATGLVMANLGRMYAPVVQDDAIAGVTLDGELRARWAPGAGSVARAEVLYASADTASTSSYTGVMTGNSYGIAGAVPASHGMLLLMSDARSINRMVAIVPDISGGGRGLLGFFGSFGFDPIPDKLNATASVGHARTADGATWGTEINAKVVYRPMALMDVGVYGAFVAPGAASGVTSPPWAAYVAMDWLVLP
jgi:hypothetical protein